MRARQLRSSLITFPILFPLLLAMASAVAAPPATAAATITVSAAASLADVLDAIQRAFEANNPGTRLELNLGSSGALRHQIQHGAPVDVFLSAAEEPVQALIAAGLAAPEDVRIFATNRLVLVRGPHASAGLQTWEDLLRSDVRRIAVGNPEHVPAGQYSRTVLENLGLWEQLQNKLVFGEDVRQVLAYVESGAADAALVYSTDAQMAQRVRALAPAPPGTHPPIRYSAAVVRTSRAPREARAFVDFLLSEDSRAILTAHGFGAPEDEE